MTLTVEVSEEVGALWERFSDEERRPFVDTAFQRALAYRREYEAAFPQSSPAEREAAVYRRGSDSDIINATNEAVADIDSKEVITRDEYLEMRRREGAVRRRFLLGETKP